jgi:hypothetical protein
VGVSAGVDVLSGVDCWVGMEHLRDAWCGRQGVRGVAKKAAIDTWGWESLARGGMILGRAATEASEKREGSSEKCRAAETTQPLLKPLLSGLTASW